MRRIALRGSGVRCLVCGRRFASVSPHFIKSHKLTTEEYKARYDVKYTMSADLRRHFSVTRTRWTKSRIVERLKARHREGRTFAHDALKIDRRDRGLLPAARYRFGTYRRALLAAGLRPELAYSKPILTRGRVIAELRRAHRTGLPLAATALRTRRRGLYKATRRLFGNYEAAVRSAGLDYARVRARRHPYKRKDILDIIRERHHTGKALHWTAVRREERGLAARASAMFGSWEDALRAAGLDAGKIPKRRRWTRSSVLSTLKVLTGRDGRLSATRLRAIDSGLAKAAYERFGSVAVAMNYALRS